MLKPLGAYVLKADDIVHDLLSRDVLVIQKIKEVFGEGVLSEGKVNRKALADLVFTNSKLLNSLEAILHPKVVKIIQETYNLVQNCDTFVVEFPLLFEIGFDSWFDEILFVTAKKEICKKRFLEKGFSEEQFENRLKRFSPESEKIAKADYVIENNGSIENLKQEIEKWTKKINKRNP